MKIPDREPVAARPELTAEMHREAVQDVTLLQESRCLLLERLERVMVALALTLDAEAAAEEPLARMQEQTGVHRINGQRTVEWSMLAQRYPDLIHAVGLVNDDLQLNCGRTRP